MTLVKWKPVLGPASKRLSAVIVCPGCGVDVGVSRLVHTIAPGGALTPSMICPHCPFHEWVTLEDYK